MYELQPILYALCHYLDNVCTFAAEQEFHARFKSESLGNEWYPITLKPAAVEYLQNLAVIMHPEPLRTVDRKPRRGKQVHPKSLENLKRGRSKYGVPTQSIRVPVELLPAVQYLIDQFVAARKASDPLCGGTSVDPIDTPPGSQTYPNASTAEASACFDGSGYVRSRARIPRAL